MAGYYSRYIKNYAIIVEPFTCALKEMKQKGENNMDRQKEQSVWALINQTNRKPILYGHYYDSEFFVQTDASEKGIGTLLDQRRGSEEHPIIFLSRKFTVLRGVLAPPSMNVLR